MSFMWELLEVRGLHVRSSCARHLIPTSYSGQDEPFKRITKVPHVQTQEYRSIQISCFVKTYCDVDDLGPEGGIPCRREDVPLSPS